MNTASYALLETLIIFDGYLPQTVEHRTHVELQIVS